MAEKMLWVVGLVFLALIASPVSTAITCQEATTKLLPCLQYLKGNGGDTPPAPCCVSAKALNSMVTSHADRQAVCECFKKAAKGVGAQEDRAQQLVKTCDINVGIPVSFNADCSKAN